MHTRSTWWFVVVVVAIVADLHRTSNGTARSRVLRYAKEIRNFLHNGSSSMVKFQSTHTRICFTTWKERRKCRREKKGFNDKKKMPEEENSKEKNATFGEQVLKRPRNRQKSTEKCSQWMFNHQLYHVLKTIRKCCFFWFRTETNFIQKRTKSWIGCTDHFGCIIATVLNIKLRHSRAFAVDCN